MKKLGLYFAFFALLGGLCGCASQRHKSQISVVDKEVALTAGKWSLISVRNDIQGSIEYPKPDRIPTLQINKEGQYSGYDGCNSFQGNCTFSGDSIAFKSSISTLKACFEEGLVDEFLRNAFQQITNYSIEGDQLILKRHSEPYIIYKR